MKRQPPNVDGGTSGQHVDATRRQPLPSEIEWPLGLERHDSIVGGDQLCKPVRADEFSDGAIEILT